MALILAGAALELRASGSQADGQGLEDEAPDAVRCLAAARSAEEKRDWRTALAEYGCARASAGGTSERTAALVGVSRCHLRLDEFRPAVEAAEAAFAVDPSDGTVLAAYGAALLRAGQLGRAREMLSGAVESRPDLARAHMNLGRLLLASGEGERGIGELVRAHEIRGRHPSPRKVPIDLGGRGS
jgi:Flp pilus assembly protein TadD